MGELGVTNHLRSDPSMDIIQDIITGARRLKIVRQTLELGLFDEIESFHEPPSAAAIAKKLGYNPDVTERLLNCLACFKLLEKSKSYDGVFRYTNSPSTSKHLTKSKQNLIPCLMCEANMVLPALDNLSTVIKKGTTDSLALQMMGLEPNNNSITEPNNNSNNSENDNNNNTKHIMPMKPPPMAAQMMFISAMDGLARACAPALTRAFDLSWVKSAVDLGGGSGCLAHEFARTYPRMRMTVFELPHVANYLQKQQSKDTKTRVDIVAGDFFKDSFPSADLFILSHVIHDWDQDKIDTLLSKVYDSLPPGGALLLLEKVLNEDKDGPSLSISIDVVMAVISNGRERTLSEYRKLLKKHSFANTQMRRISGLNDYDAILAKKPL